MKTQNHQDFVKIDESSLQKLKKHKISSYKAKYMSYTSWYTSYYSYRMISHLVTTSSLHSIVVSTPALHPGGRGSIPHGSKLVLLFIHFFQKNQILRAKISPFPWEKSGNILISYSHEPKDRFKGIKFLVGPKVMGTFCLSGWDSLC